MAGQESVPKNKVEIKDGHVIIKDFVNRKTSRGYNAHMFKDAETSVKGEMNVTFNNLELARDFLVLNMIKEAVLDGKSAEVNQDFIDNLMAEDFKKIADHCENVNDNKKKEETSKSS